MRFWIVLLWAAVAPLIAQTYRVGDHVEALPFGYDWYPCLVTQSGPSIRVKCTNIDGTTSDYSVPLNRLRPDSGKASAEMARRWAQRYPIGARVDAAPNGERNGYFPCTVLSVKGNGADIGIYHLRCDFGYDNGPIEVDVGAHDYIRPASAAVAAQAAQRQAALDERNRPPVAVRSGAYVCSTFSGGRLEVVPSLDMRVTGPSTYVDRSGTAGSFSYDTRTGLVIFRGGAWSGAQARYSSMYGGKFQLLLNGRPANTDCSLEKN